MQKANEKSAQGTQVTSNAAQVASNSQAAEAAAKPRPMRNKANDESKLEMFSKEAALRACKTAFDKEGAAREFVYSLGFSAQGFKGLRAEDLDTKSRNGFRFSTWETWGAVKRYAEEHDLKGEKAAKAAKEAERKALAEARARMEEKKRITTKTREGAAGWLVCKNSAGEIVGYQRPDINGAPIGKIYKPEEYEAKKAADKAAAEQRAAAVAAATKKAADKAKSRSAKRNK